MAYHLPRSKCSLGCSVSGGGGYLHWDWMGYPPFSQMGVHPAIWMGYPPIKKDEGTPISQRMLPPLGMMGYPPSVRCGYPLCEQTDRQTDTCQNITFPILRMRAVIISLSRASAQWKFYSFTSVCGRLAESADSEDNGNCINLHTANTT